MIGCLKSHYYFMPIKVYYFGKATLKFVYDISSWFPSPPKKEPTWIGRVEWRKRLAFRIKHLTWQPQCIVYKGWFMAFKLNKKLLHSRNYESGKRVWSLLPFRSFAIIHLMMLLTFPECNLAKVEIKLNEKHDQLLDSSLKHVN